MVVVFLVCHSFKLFINAYEVYDHWFKTTYVEEDTTSTTTMTYDGNSTVNNDNVTVEAPCKEEPPRYQKQLDLD